MHHVSQQGEMPKSIILQTWALHCARKTFLGEVRSSSSSEMRLTMRLGEQHMDSRLEAELGNN
jgi:hypothetical protein